MNYSSAVDGANQVVEEIKALGSCAMAVKADVSKEEDVKSMFRQVIERYGTVDILVNNAGLQQDAPLVDMTLAQWQRVIDINRPANSSVRGKRPESFCGGVWCRSAPSRPARSFVSVLTRGDSLGGAR